MKKAIVKWLKIFLSVFLVSSMILPSYAAIAASDGSSFVTKAEFDSSLADFNSRLTTFEAGINSKIDSQVTSYLDRNGIWSGKEQTLSSLFSSASSFYSKGKRYGSFFFNGYSNYGYQSNAKSADSTLYNSITYAALSQLVWSVVSNQYSGGVTSGCNHFIRKGQAYSKACSKIWEVVPEINKSGLMHIQNRFTSTDSSGRSGFCYLIKVENNTSYGHLLQTFKCNFCFFQANSSDDILVETVPKAATVFCAADAYYPVGKDSDYTSSASGFGKSTCFVLDTAPSNLYFFVSKGTKLFARIELECASPSTSLANSLQNNVPNAQCYAGYSELNTNWDTYIVVY